MGPSCATRWPKRWRGGRRPPRIPAMWVLAVILLVALMIPIAAILVDSPLGRSVARRLEGQGSGGGGGDVKGVGGRPRRPGGEASRPSPAGARGPRPVASLPAPPGGPQKKGAWT